MQYLIVIGILLIVFYFLGKFGISHRFISEKLFNYSKLPTLFDFLKVGFILTAFIVFLIIAAIIIISLLFRFLIVAIPVGVVLMLIYFIYLAYHFFRK